MTIRCADCDVELCDAPCDVCHNCWACCFRSHCEKAPATIVCDVCEVEFPADKVCRDCTRCIATCCVVQGELCAECACHLEVSVPGDIYCEECACHTCGQLWSAGGGVGGSGESCVSCETATQIEEQEMDEAEAKQKKAKMDD